MDNPGEKSSHQQPQEEEITSTVRAVAFPDNDVYEEKPIGALRTKGLEMKREMTQEDRELAAAGYEHLEEKKAQKGAQDSQFNNVEIVEHQLTYSGLRDTLETSIDTKDPGKSTGLTSDEAKARLVKYGHNVLTPPKKKSAFRKVRASDCRFKTNLLILYGSTSTVF